MKEEMLIQASRQCRFSKEFKKCTESYVRLIKFQIHIPHIDMYELLMDSEASGGGYRDASCVFNIGK